MKLKPASEPRTCAGCGTGWSPPVPRFCGHCGARLREAPAGDEVGGHDDSADGSGATVRATAGRPGAQLARVSGRAVGAAVVLVLVGLLVNAAMTARNQTVDLAGTEAIARSIEDFDPPADPSLDPETCAADGCFVGCATPPTLDRPVLWCRDHGGSAAPPVVSGARVVLVEPGGLLGVERSTGEQRWRLAIGDTNASVPTVTGPMGLLGQLVLVADGANQRLLAVKLVDGTVAWQGPPGSDGRAIEIGNTILVVGSTGTLWSLDGQTGRALWSVQADAPAWRAPVVTDGGMVVTLGARGLESWDLATGLGVWRRILGLGTFDNDDLDPDDDFPVLGPIVVGDLVVVATTGGTVVALDEADGTNLWEVPFGVPLRSPPVASDTDVYVVTTEGLLNRIDVATGDVRWDLALDGRGPDRALAVGRDDVYVANDEQITRVGIQGVTRPRVYDLGRRIIGAPVVAGQTLYVTTRQALYVIDAG